MNEIAQPLLYNFIRIPGDKLVKFLSRLIGNGSRNGRLCSVETVLFEEEVYGWERRRGADTLARLSREVPLGLSEVKQFITLSDFWSLDKFHGSSLSRAFLACVDLDTVAISRLKFPSLAILGLYFVNLDPDSLPIESFPSLRHLRLEGDGLSDTHITTLSTLASQLNSINLTSDAFDEATSELPALPFASILVNLPWNWIARVLQAEPAELDSFASLLQDSNRFARLEVIYLPPSSSLVQDYRTDKIITSIGNVALAAKNRNIEVILEEQSDDVAGECQISEDFMTRMTQRRTTREVDEKK
ncbi:uncharacterized protein JCM6883_007392 [Sporobolomyces salmoneus]|uniref:uncharacterized protein n=1 Tax=Sporobolomyces salmoneus TaxID=183962 RepID=UPI00316FF91C